MTDVFYRAPARRYPTIAHGEGVYLYDADGRRYLDGSAGALVASVGHGRTEVAEAMARQASRVAFAHTARFTSEAQERLAAAIAAHVPRPLRYSYFVSGGSEATETAVKLARQVQLARGQPRRTKVLARWASYHGNSLGALALSGHLARRRPYDPLLPPTFRHFPPPRGEHEGCEVRDDGSCPCLDAFAAVLQQEDPETVAAVFLEPVGGSALSGFRPHAGYLAGVARLCRRHGILLVLDEVMSGVGRTGRFLALEHEGVVPDMVTLAKGLSGGYAPLGAVVASEEVHDVIRDRLGRFEHGFTYSGHPVACAAGVAVLDILDRERLVENAARQGEALTKGLARLQRRHPVVTEVRGIGLMQALVLRSDPARPGGGTAARLGEIAFGHGLIVYPGSGSPDGVDGDHVLIGPPLSIRAAEVDELIALLDRSLADLA